MQCVWWGHPSTTGHSDNIDFYLSLDVEVADAWDHYTEQVVRMDYINTAPILPASLVFFLKKSFLFLVKSVIVFYYIIGYSI